MKSIQSLNAYPSSLPILADDVLEFHAARLLLLLRICGKNNSINGLTKLAKLDFFVRYPKFFTIACEELNVEINPIEESVESHMIRFHYGPWDQRYYHVLAYLESKNLINVGLKGKTFRIDLTESGKEAANQLNMESTFENLAAHMEQVNLVLGSKRGTELKNLVYQLFDVEVAQLSLEEIIRQ